MAATDQMLDIALRLKPHACCLVPEKRTERTTEGGLDVVGGHDYLKPYVAELSRAGVRVSLFVEPSREALEAAASLRAPVVELHTGAWCDALAQGEQERAEREFARLRAAVGADARRSASNVTPAMASTSTPRAPIAALPEIVELNIGHFLIGEAIFVGLATSRARDAHGDGRGARPCRVSGDDRRHRRRSLRHQPHRGDARPVRRAFHRALLHRRRAARARSAAATRAASYAKRFAAKEACAKALGTGLRHGVFWRDMGVVNLPSGQPTMRLTGGAAARLAAITPAGCEAFIHLTITDEHPLAQAFVVIEARERASARPTSTV